MSTTVTSTSTSWWKTPTSTSDSTSTSTGTNNLSDFNTFMQLLATELENQDPTNPVSNTEYVSQMAQINTLSQLQSISSSVDTYRAYALIGATVAYTTTDSSGNTSTATGVVQSVVTSDDTTYLTIGGQKVKLSAVTAVTSTTSDSSTASTTTA